MRPANSRSLLLNATMEEFDLVDKIIRRAEGLGIEYDRRGVSRDIIATHLNVVPLKLADWLGGSGTDFAHDYVGIYRHFDRAEIKLTDSFLPRFADLDETGEQE